MVPRNVCSCDVCYVISKALVHTSNDHMEVNEMHMHQIDQLIKKELGIDTFVNLADGGKVMTHQSGVNDPVGVWKQEGDQITVVLFGKKEEHVFKVTESIPETNEKKESKVKHTQCEVLVKGRPCKNNATFEREGHKVCGVHVKAKTVKWMVEIKGALDQAMMNTNSPEQAKAGIEKARETLENKEEQPMLYKSHVLGKVTMTKDENNKVVKMVFPIIAASSKERTIEDHLKVIVKQFAGQSSVHYVFFKDTEGNKVYYRRTRGMQFQRFTPHQGAEIKVKPMNQCSRCVGTGVYQGHSGVTRTDGFGVSVKQCFSCLGTGIAGYKKEGK